MTGPRRIGAVILARMDSSRLPGKALAEISGAPLIAHVARRLPVDAFTGGIVLATTDRPVDDELAEVGAGLGLKVFRGAKDDVAGRVLAAARACDIEGVLRVNGDAPFSDSDLIREAIRCFSAPGVDFVTNLRPRTFPYGVSAELFATDLLETCLATTEYPYDREHVTPSLYRLVTPPRLATITDRDAPVEGPSTRICLAIDKPEDLAAFKAFIALCEGGRRTMHFREAVASGLFRTLPLPEDISR